MRLADLRVVTRRGPCMDPLCFNDSDHAAHTKGTSRPATVADLIAALKEEGAEIAQARQESRGWRPVMRVSEPGRYLVFRIDEEGREMSDQQLATALIVLVALVVFGIIGLIAQWLIDKWEGR